MNLAEEMKKRNMTEEHLMEYMIFEDECIEKGFTFKDILKVLEGEKMREKKLYVCEVCKTEYENKLACQKCEKNHKYGEKIVWGRHLSIGQDATGYPVTIDVVMSDGKTVRYKKA